MALRLLFLLFLIVPLHADDDSWYNKINVKMELGVYKPTLLGDIKNLVSTASFKDDFKYNDARASNFILTIQPEYDYWPNLEISYFNMHSEKGIGLAKPIKIANGFFSSAIYTKIDYQVASFIFYQDFKLKGSKVYFFGMPFYSGDLEFDVGLNTHTFKWNFDIQNLSDLTQPPSWIRANAFIFSPYLGFKYYFYAFRLNASASVIAFSKVKSSVYKTSFDYTLIDDLYISAGYLYEEFKVQEQGDRINFITSGYTVSFKYTF